MKNARCLSLERRVHLAALCCRGHHAISPPLPPQPVHVNLLLDLPESHSQQLHTAAIGSDVKVSLEYLQLMAQNIMIPGGNVWNDAGKCLQLEVGNVEANQKGMEG